MKHKRNGVVALSLGALGVVFGDIGTSPLYALQVVFSPIGLHLPATQQNILGIISLILWSITLGVSVKYLIFIMSADNEGEGGVLALVALIKQGRLSTRRKWLYSLLGLAGVSLFYGDSVITPAISVLSAVEGIGAVAPSMTTLIVPIALVILLVLFGIQRFGTSAIGRYFGPVMLIWFIAIGLGGVGQIALHPDILMAISPLAAIHFIAASPILALVAMSAVVLSITGGEALYADMGHFGRRPISHSWFYIVFPSLALCYLGQGAVLLGGPLSTTSFYSLFPTTLLIPMIILSTVATFIASQSVITGAFSLTRQAIQLGFVPRMRVLHTSVKESGQIYLPFVNALLGLFVVLLVVYFGSSAKLSNAYGIAVSGVLATDTLLFLIVARTLWQRAAPFLLLVGVLLVPLDVVFIISNVPKLLNGGWFPILIAVGILLVITTWVKGESILSKERRILEGPITDFVFELHTSKPKLERSQGVAIFIGHHPDYTPLALRAMVADFHELPTKVVIISAAVTNLAHISEEDRYVFDTLGYKDGLSLLKIRYGYHDHINIPRALEAVRERGSEIDFPLADVSYIISASKVVPVENHKMSLWRKNLFAFMARNQVSTSDYFKLPVDHTEEMTTLIKL